MTAAGPGNAEGRLSGATSGLPGFYGFWLGQGFELSVERVTVANKLELVHSERGLERPRLLATNVPEGTFPFGRWLCWPIIGHHTVTKPTTYRMEASKPTVSLFLGIVIFMNYSDHMPPHFHARYQGHEASFTFDGELLVGDMPSRQRKFIAAWALLHEEDLAANWELCREHQAPLKIDPLR